MRTHIRNEQTTNRTFSGLFSYQKGLSFLPFVGASLLAIPYRIDYSLDYIGTRTILFDNGICTILFHNGLSPSPRLAFLDLTLDLELVWYSPCLA